MEQGFFKHTISPEKVIRGNRAWEIGKHLIPPICKRPLLIGRSKATFNLREKLFNDLKDLNIFPVFAELAKDCCEADLIQIERSYKLNNCDGVVCAGGGKVLDAGKLIGKRIKAPCITIPLSAATCAGWTALANIYSESGKFIRDEELETCPKILIFDHDLVRTAPSRTLASGVADALAKWYESSISSNNSNDALVQQAVQMSRVLRDQLLIDGLQALKNNTSDSWERVAQGCALTAGLIGGIGGRKCRTAAAHALHNGFTQLNFEKKSLHGEIVGFGILVQLKLEEKYFKKPLINQSRIQLIKLLKELHLPITINSLGLGNINHHDLLKACKFACSKESEIKNLPFNVDPNILMQAIRDTDRENISYLDKETKEISLI